MGSFVLEVIDLQRARGGGRTTAVRDVALRHGLDHEAFRKYVYRHRGMRSIERLRGLVAQWQHSVEQMAVPAAARHQLSVLAQQGEGRRTMFRALAKSFEDGPI